MPLKNGRIPLGVRGGHLHAMLPGGSIATDMPAGRGGGVVLNSHTIVVKSEAEAQAVSARIGGADPDAIIDTVLADIASGGRIPKAMRRRR